MKDSASSPRVRPAAQAGRFYPSAPEALKRVVRGYLDEALSGGLADPKAVIAPHAGYRYSGPVAGSAFAPWAAQAGVIRRVVVIGPSHWVDFPGIALPGVEALATPLGEVPIDAAAVAALADLPSVRAFPEAHTPEHGIEVELPFLQSVLSGFAIVPLVVGRETDEVVAAAVERLWGGAETRFVISSDLSHYLPYAEAREVDRGTASAIERGELEALGARRACGYRPIRAMLLAGKAHSLRARTVDLRNSGDTAGPRDSVVGYGAFHFAAEPAAPVFS